MYSIIFNTMNYYNWLSCEKIIWVRFIQVISCQQLNCFNRQVEFLWEFEILFWQVVTFKYKNLTRIIYYMHRLFRCRFIHELSSPQSSGLINEEIMLWNYLAMSSWQMSFTTFQQCNWYLANIQVWYSC